MMQSWLLASILVALAAFLFQLYFSFVIFFISLSLLYTFSSPASLIYDCVVPACISSCRRINKVTGDEVYEDARLH